MCVAGDAGGSFAVRDVVVASVELARTTEYEEEPQAGAGEGNGSVTQHHSYSHFPKSQVAAWRRFLPSNSGLQHGASVTPTKCLQHLPIIYLCDF